jgi:hypothetical protein
MSSNQMYGTKSNRVSCRVVAAFFAVLATCVAHGANAPTPTVLRFDWGNELDANVIATREEIVSKGDTQRVSRLEARFRLHAVREAGRYVLTFSNLSMTLDDQPVPQSAQPGLLGPVTGLVLSYDVAANGDFIALRDFERLQSFSERSYATQNAQRSPRTRATEQEAERAMEAGGTPEVLQLEASRTWGALVGMWAGLTMTEGKPLYSNSAVNVPIINAPVTFNAAFELVRKESCESGTRKRSCVRLRATSRPDPTELSAAIRKLKESSGSAVEPMSASDGMRVEDRFELLTDPQTLKPRWAEWIRGSDVSGFEDGKDRVQSRQSIRTRMTFDY